MFVSSMGLSTTLGNLPLCTGPEYWPFGIQHNIGHHQKEKYPQRYNTILALNTLALWEFLKLDGKIKHNLYLIELQHETLKTVNWVIVFELEIQ